MWLFPRGVSTNNDYTRWFSRRDPTWSPNIGGHDSNLWVWGHVSTIRTKNCQAKGLLFAKKIDGTDPTQHNLNKSWSDFLVSPAVFFNHLNSNHLHDKPTNQLETSSRWLNHPLWTKMRRSNWIISGRGENKQKNKNHHLVTWNWSPEYDWGISWIFFCEREWGNQWKKKVQWFAHRAPGKIPQTSPNPHKEIPS